MTRVTVAQIAAAAGVSKSTVSWALRNHPAISEPTRERVRSIARELGYAPNPILAERMSLTRKTGSPGAQGTIALIDASPVRVEQGDVLPELCSGARGHAEALGYACDRFLFTDFKNNPARLARVLQARGIRGVVLYHTSRHLPAALAPIYGRFACATTCYKPLTPPLHCAFNDQFFNAQQAVKAAFESGYQRPVAFVNRWLDEQLDHRISAALRQSLEVSSAPDAQRVFIQPETDRELKLWNILLRRAFDRCDADCIITHSHNVQKFVVPFGHQAGTTVGIIHLDRGEYCRSLGLAGMVQRYAEVGRCAVDLVVAQLQSGEKGIPPVQRCLMVESYFEGGPSCKTPPR